MGIQKLPIESFLDRSSGYLVLDVRSPGEYRHAHIPGAVNLPLFTDEERKQVGTAYKQQSRETAIRLGLDFFGPKMRPMVEKAEALVREHAVARDADSPPTVFIHCWRGGMRSGAVAWLLDLYGFRVYTLAGGYKAYRNYVLNSFEWPYRFRLLGGFTGSGKTEVLQNLQQMGEKIIDLEAVASHKGSAFGSFKMPPQPTQEMFENLLSHELRIKSGFGENRFDNQDYIWLEDESQRIGDVNLPISLWNAMRHAPVWFLDIPFENRLEHLAEEYRDCSRQKLMDCTGRIRKRLGPNETKNTLIHLENGELKEAFRYLLKYYDKHYLKALHNREGLDTLLTRIPCETVSAENAALLTKHQPV